MKQSTRDISVQADKSKTTDLKLLSVDKPQILGSISNLNRAAARTMKKFSCETYFQGISQRVDALFPSQGSESTLRSAQIFTAQKHRRNLDLEDKAIELRKFTLSAPSEYSMVLVDEGQRIVEWVLQAQQKSYLGNFNYGSEK